PTRVKGLPLNVTALGRFCMGKTLHHGSCRKRWGQGMEAGKESQTRQTGFVGRREGPARAPGPVGSIAAKLRRKLSLHGSRRGRWRVVLEVAQQLADAPVAIDLLQEFLLELDGQGQGKTQNVSQGAQRELAVEEFAELLVSCSQACQPVL